MYPTVAALSCYHNPHVYPELGRNLTQSDVGKLVIRVMPYHWKAIGRYDNSFRYHGNSDANFPLEWQAVRLVAISETILKIDNPPDFPRQPRETTWNDDCGWTTLEELRAYLHKDPQNAKK